MICFKHDNQLTLCEVYFISILCLFLIKIHVIELIITTILYFIQLLCIVVILFTSGVTRKYLLQKFADVNRMGIT